MQLDTTIRLATTTDLPFIVDSFATSFTFTYPNLYSFEFLKRYRSKASVLLENGTAIVAVLTDDPMEIISFLLYKHVGNFFLVHYGYTKADARRTGLLRNLLSFANPDKLPIIFTHAAKNENIMKHLVSKYIYDPSMLENL